MFYRFKTFTTSYYFPNIDKTTSFMYGLYSAYGGRLAKIYWYLFKKFKLVRLCTAVRDCDLDFPYQLIRSVDGTDSIMAFNMGSPGVEQKISILGFDYQKLTPFFAKFSQKPVAMALTKNEVEVYRILNQTGLVPQLLGERITDEYAYLKAEYIKGARPSSMDLTDAILDLCVRLKDFHLTEEMVNPNGLKLSLSHGDFCPWNMLVDGRDTKLIDWELAADRPLGADLFTYITQISILFSPDKPLKTAVSEKDSYIARFFLTCGIKDYKPYLRAFAEERVAYEMSKGNHERAEKFKELLS